MLGRVVVIRSAEAKFSARRVDGAGHLVLVVVVLVPLEPRVLVLVEDADAHRGRRHDGSVSGSRDTECQISLLAEAVAAAPSPN